MNTGVRKIYDQVFRLSEFSNAQICVKQRSLLLNRCLLPSIFYSVFAGSQRIFTLNFNEFLSSLYCCKIRFYNVINFCYGRSNITGYGRNTNCNNMGIVIGGQIFWHRKSICSREYNNFSMDNSRFFSNAYQENCQFTSPDNVFSDGTYSIFRPHPFNRRFAFSKRPFFPIEPRNLRTPGVKRRKKRRGRGDKCSAKGIRDRHDSGLSPRSKTWEGGRTPLYRRLPKWPAAWLGRQRKGMDPLNLARLRYFIEKGRIDSRFPITQRHIHDSGCCKVKNGIRLFNVNDYPFPYKIDIEVCGADQSSIDVIKKVGGTVTIVYMNRVNLRAHIKPFKFEVLPKTARPNLEIVHYMEKMRARGCIVRYIKPQWLIEEEKRLKYELAEFEAENYIVGDDTLITNSLLANDSYVEDPRNLLVEKYRSQIALDKQIKSKLG